MDQGATMACGLKRRMAAALGKGAADQANTGHGIPKRHLAHRIGKVDLGIRPWHLPARALGHRQVRRGNQSGNLGPACRMAGRKDHELRPAPVPRLGKSRHDPGFLAIMG